MWSSGPQTLGGEERGQKGEEGRRRNNTEPSMAAYVF